jgi:serine protease Do
VARPYVGLVMQPVEIPDSLQKKAGVNAGAGLLVMHVESGGPADLAGVLLGDVLLDMEGRAFSDLDDVYEALRAKSAGQEVQTSLIRGGTRLQLTIRIGERPSR